MSNRSAAQASTGRMSNDGGPRTRPANESPAGDDEHAQRLPGMPPNDVGLVVHSRDRGADHQHAQRIAGPPVQHRLEPRFVVAAR